MTIIDHIIDVEGGYVNDPEDPGGETKFGISKRAYPEEDIKALTKERARYLLERDYIFKPGFDKLPPSSLRDQLIDFGYHSGPATAIRALQGVLGVEGDGKLGPYTLSRVLEYAEPRRLNNLLAAARINFLADIVAAKPKKVRFLRGWMTRATSYLV